VDFPECPVLPRQRALFSLDSPHPRPSRGPSRSSADTPYIKSQNALRLLSLAALVFCGCSSSSRPSDAQSTSHPSQPRGFISGTLTDPSINGMAAQSMIIPAGWKVQGIVLTSPCMTLPSAVYRAYAPGGLTEMRLTPALAWKWSSLSIPKDKGCLPYSGPLSAADFLNKYVETIPGGVHVVGPMPVDAAYRKTAEDLAARLNQQAQQFAQQAGSRGPGTARFTADVAALHVQTRNGSFVIDQRLTTAVQCQIRDPGQFMAGGNCSAQIAILRAPQGKLDALVSLVDGNNLPGIQMTPEWKEAETKIIYDRGQAGLRAIQRQANIAMQRQQAMFNSFMETSRVNHEAFMNQQEQRFQSSQNAAFASMNAQSTAASDFIDYALDQQTVVGQGGLAKVSNSYDHTWSSTVGNQTQWYQTDNPNADPNGVLAGNWTPDTKVHGNGQSY
jgi:hypothetical protein